MEKAGDALLLPVDATVAPAIESGSEAHTVSREAIPSDQMLLDIGPESAKQFAAAVGEARTVLWNGPVGVFEHEPFDAGSRVVAKAVADATAAGASSIVGGGDTAAAIAAFGLAGEVTHVSTGGGAALEFLAGQTLPGVAALTDRGAA
jgi:phosphoglycerate kinase